MTMPGLLAYSSNVGTILIADKLGKQRVYEYQQKFGLGQATGEGMPGEATGRLLAPDEWSGSASGSVPIGHERRRHADPDGGRVRARSPTTAPTSSRT